MADLGGFRLALNVNYYYGGEKINIYYYQRVKVDGEIKLRKKIHDMTTSLDKKLKIIISAIILSRPQTNTLNTFIYEILKK